MRLVLQVVRYRDPSITHYTRSPPAQRFTKPRTVQQRHRHLVHDATELTHIQPAKV